MVRARLGRVEVTPNGLDPFGKNMYPPGVYGTKRGPKIEKIPERGIPGGGSKSGLGKISKRGGRGAEKIFKKVVCSCVDCSSGLERDG